MHGVLRVGPVSYPSFEGGWGVYPCFFLLLGVVAQLAPGILRPHPNVPCQDRNISCCVSQACTAARAE